jgi:hypothetical protein
MNTPENTYDHRPVDGLPASLLVPEGETIAVIVLMQRQAGLNRQRRKDLQKELLKAKRKPTSDREIMADENFQGVSDTDRFVLKFFTDACYRFTNFWRGASSQWKPGTQGYAVTVEVQLLKAYDPDWMSLLLDETSLVEDCREWSRIRERIEKRFPAPNMPLNVFMLWPKILNDLKRWDDQDSDKRLRLQHAVFALSSIGWTDWFVNQAVVRCPEIEPEFASLKRSAGHGASDMSGNSDVANPDQVDDNWAQLMQRLDMLVAELKTHPSREAVSDLVDVAAELNRLGAKLPQRIGSMTENFKERQREIMSLLKTLATRAEFEWLDATLIAQIDARWQLALRERSEPEQIEELADDAVAALGRSRTAAEEYTEATAVVKASRLAVQAAEQEEAGAKGFNAQKIARHRRSEAQKQNLADEDVQFSKKERLVDAASPFEAPFDYSSDYVAELDNSASPMDAAPTLLTGSGASEVAQAVSESEAPVSEEDSAILAQAPIGPIDAGNEGSEPSTIESDKEVVAVFPQSADEEHAEGIDDYNDAAGEVCRPIWHFLSTGQAALAFHAASWIEKCHPGLRMPPPDLLAAIPLAEELILPDGAIRAELDARFEKFAPEDFNFTADSPRVWRTALNLLLAAATLRPMVLAPNSGAASVAAYLHQDGRYPAMYALIQKLRGMSVKLVGFRIDPTALRQARGEAALKDELDELCHTAGDWLKNQAPAYTIKFAPATKVWQCWVREGGKINALVAPVVHNRMKDAPRVREMLDEMSEPDYISRLVRETDRKDLKRKKGEDIHTGALEHLQRHVEEALKLPRKWLRLVDLLDKRSGSDQLRSLLEQVNASLREHRTAVERELGETPDNDAWEWIQSGQKQVLRAIHSLLSLFDAGTNLPEDEPSPGEVFGRPLLCVPDLPLDENWIMGADPEMALSRLRANVMSAEDALRQRLDRGDILGAEMMIDAKLVDAETISLRQERERWKQIFRKELAECRRSVEVGLAYGYLSSTEYSQFESELARQEARIEELRRFDVATNRIRAIREQVAAARDVRAQAVRVELRNIARTEETQAAIAAVEEALNDGDIAIANEHVLLLTQGEGTLVDQDEEGHKDFDRFFPAAMQAIETWLEGQRREAIEKTLRQGQNIPGLDASRIAGAQREQSAKMFVAWSDMKSQQEAQESRLKLLLSGLGFIVKELQRVERVSGREIWDLSAEPMEDRHICPLPMYGSSANGRYRIICVWGRPTEDELLQWVGDSSVSRPTLLLYFGRMTERKWREMSRLAKTKRRSFVMLDETLLVYLCSAKGSRLEVWFDVAMPFSYAVPYDATAGLVPPEMFYGRGEELEAVRGLNGRCFIYGGRQLGKTALLKRAEQSFHAPQQAHYARCVDLRAEGIGVSRTVAEIWVTLYERLKELQIIDAKLPAPVPGKKQGIEPPVIRAIREFLEENFDRRVLLLLDEADRFFEQDARNDFEETRRLKQLMDETQRRFKVVFAGLHNVLRMTEHPNHPLAHFGEPIEIGPLQEGQEAREAANLIRKPMAAAGFAFESRSLAIRILAQTNYYPSLIQLYCSHLLRHMLGQVANRQRQEGPRYVITDRDIDQVYSSDALRDEIRAKFRLTLQLDPRYEVLAYSMALDSLQNRYQQSEGMPWRTIRRAALQWWEEGFRDTNELDFRVLLDEMVGLGVLRRVATDHYVLRNPNVLLLLGTEEEIETVLYKEREPAVEFESGSFRPPLRRGSSSEPRRNVFTYQQLSHLLSQRNNSITVVTGTEAAGITRVVTDLEDYLGNGNVPVVIENCVDRQSFGKVLQSKLSNRPKEQVTIFVIPEAAPWTDQWIQEAQDQLGRLKSESKFASLVFVADPAALWRLLDHEPAVPWMSLLQWSDGFLRHWLEECQLQLEPEDRSRLVEKTGLWPMLIMELAGHCTERRILKERMDSTDTDVRHGRFGLDVPEPASVIKILAELDEPVIPDDLSDIAERSMEYVQTCLRWSELLGLARNEGTGCWTVDPIVSKILTRDS